MIIYKKLSDSISAKDVLILSNHLWLIHESSTPHILTITRHIPEFNEWTQYFVAFTKEKGWVLELDQQVLEQNYSHEKNSIDAHSDSFYAFLAFHGFDLLDKARLSPSFSEATENPFWLSLSNHPLQESRLDSDSYELSDIDYPPLVFKKLDSRQQALELLELNQSKWLVSEGKTLGLIYIHTLDTCVYLGFTHQGWLHFSADNFKDHLLKLDPKESMYHARAFVNKLADIGFDISDTELLLPAIEQVTTHLPFQSLQQLPRRQNFEIYSQLPVLFFNQEKEQHSDAHIFKRFNRLEDANELLKTEGKMWLIRETSNPRIVAVHLYVSESDSHTTRRYAHLEKEWVLIGNDLDPLERYLIVNNTASIENHEQNFYDVLAQDGFVIEDENFLAPSESYATHSPILKSLSVYPASSKNLAAAI